MQLVSASALHPLNEVDKINLKAYLQTGSRFGLVLFQNVHEILSIPYQKHSAEFKVMVGVPLARDFECKLQFRCTKPLDECVKYCRKLSRHVTTSIFVQNGA